MRVYARLPARLFIHSFIYLFIFNCFGTYDIRTYHSGVESVASVRRVSPECRTVALATWEEFGVIFQYSSSCEFDIMSHTTSHTSSDAHATTEETQDHAETQFDATHSHTLQNTPLHFAQGTAHMLIWFEWYYSQLIDDYLCTNAFSPILHCSPFHFHGFRWS